MVFTKNNLKINNCQEENKVNGNKYENKNKSKYKRKIKWF